MSSRLEPQISPVMRRLSAYMAAVLASDIPNEVAEKGKHHLLDTLGAMEEGSRGVKSLRGKRGQIFC